MSKNNTPFTMPGADPIEEGEMIDLNFMEQTEEEKAAELAAQEARDAAKAEADALEAETQRLKDEADAQAEADAEEAKNKAEKKEDKAELPEDEKKLAAELEADKNKGKKQPMVPKSRLDEVLAKNRELAEQLKMQQGAAPKPDKDAVAFDFDAKEGEYMQHVLDGEKEKALAVRKEIRAAEQAAVAATTRATTGQDSEQVALAKAAAQIEETFPQFVIGHEKHNAEATEKVVAMRDALIRGGADAVSALNDAVDFVVRKYGFDEAPEAPKDEKVVNLDDKRKKDVQKKVDLQKKQPPDVAGEGERSRTPPAIDITKLSDEEYDALPEATRRRLRGDMI